MSEKVFFIIAISLLVVPFAIFKLWWWFFTMLGIVAFVVLVEGVVVLFTKRTLSQKFWKWSLENRTKAWCVIGFLITAWLMLMWHLAEKMFK